MAVLERQYKPEQDRRREMKRLMLLIMAVAILSACSMTGGKLPEKYQSVFHGVPYAELTKFDKAGPGSTK